MTLKGEIQQIRQIKVLAMRCFISEMNLANLIFEWTEKYNLDMQLDEVLKVKELVQKIHELVNEFDYMSRRLTGKDMSHEDNSTIFRNIYILLPQVTFQR